MGQERLGPSYFFISLVLGPLNSLFFFFTQPRLHLGVEVTELSTNIISRGGREGGREGSFITIPYCFWRYRLCVRVAYEDHTQQLRRGRQNF